MASFFRCMPDSNWIDLGLIRHGIAEPRDRGLDYPDRPLTPRGRSRTQAVMEALVNRGMALVGHEPDLSELACELLSLASERIRLKKAGLVLLHRAVHRWQLEALIRPGLLLEQQA